MKKRIILSVAIIGLIVILLGVVTHLRANELSANVFIQGTVTGHLSAIPFQDVDTYYVRVSSAGKMVITVENDQALLGAVLKIYDEYGNELLESRRLKNTEESITIDVPAEAFEEQLYIDYKIRVSAAFGSGDYTLTVMKDGEYVTEKLMNNVTLFDIEKIADEDIRMVWKNPAEEKDFSVLEIIILDFASKDQVKSLTDATGIVTLGDDLPAGSYTVLASRRGEASDPLAIHVSQPGEMVPLMMVKSVVPPKEVEKFTKGSVDKGERVGYVFELTGNELALWVVCDAKEGTNKNPWSDKKLVSADGKDVIHPRFAFDKYMCFLVANVRGTYKLLIEAKTDNKYAIGIQYSVGQYGPLLVNNQSFWQSLSKGQQCGYDISLKESATSKMVLVNFTNAKKAEAKVVIEKLESNQAPETKVIPANGSLTYPIDLSDSKVRGMWLNVTDGEVTWEIDATQLQVIKRDSFESRDTFETAELINENEPFYASISHPSDVDVYKIELNTDSSVRFRLNHIPEGMDYNLEILDDDQNIVATSANVGNSEEEFTKLLTQGTYYVKVFARNGLSHEQYRFSYAVMYTQLTFSLEEGRNEVELGKFERNDAGYLLIFAPAEGDNEHIINNITLDDYTKQSIRNNHIANLFPRIQEDKLVHSPDEGCFTVTLNSLQYKANQQRKNLQRKSNGSNYIKTQNNVIEKDFYILKRYKPIGSTDREIGDSYVKRARRVAVGNHFVIWVAVDLLEKNIFTAKKAETILSEIDSDYYNILTNEFGKEPQTGPTNILISKMRDGIGGYFSIDDLYDVPQSNGMNLLYVAYIDENIVYNSYGLGAKNDIDRYLSVIAHEFQHLIYYNQKVLINNKFNKDTWLNEGFSCLAADLIKKGYKDGIDYIDHVELFLGASTQENLTDWTEDAVGNVYLSNYGSSYLFIRYLYDQYDKILPEKLIKSIHQSSKSSTIEEIEDVIGKSFDEIFKDWAMTIALTEANIDNIFYDKKYHLNVTLKPFNRLGLTPTKNVFGKILFMNRGFLLGKVYHNQEQVNLKLIFNVDSNDHFTGVFLKWDLFQKIK